MARSTAESQYFFILLLRPGGQVGLFYYLLSVEAATYEKATK